MRNYDIYLAQIVFLRTARNSGSTVVSAQPTKCTLTNEEVTMLNELPVTFSNDLAISASDVKDVEPCKIEDYVFDKDTIIF